MWTFILILCEMYLLAGCQVTLTHNSASALADTFICGTNTQFTCTIDPAPGLMSWVKESATLTECAGATDVCVDATVDNYQFTSNVTVKEFYLTVNPVMFSNAGTFTCSNGASVDDSKTISIAAVPSAITMTKESGTGNITLQATTDCAFPMFGVSIKWYYLKELTDTPKFYTDTGFSPLRTEDSSTCNSGDCTSGVGVSKVVSTVTFVEKGSGGTSAYLQAKMVHSAAPSSSPAVVAITTNKYIIFEATPAATMKETYDCPGLGSSTAVDSKAKCICVWSSICCVILLGLFLIGIVLGCILIVCATSCCVCFYKGEGCEDCVSNDYCRCKCFISTPCGVCCNIRGLPSWYQILWASIIGIPVALGILLVWTSCNNEKAMYKLLHDEDCPENERRKSFHFSQLPDKHDKKDDDHPLVSINIPTKKAGALESIPDSAREEVTKKKKKKRRVETEDDQSD